MQWKAIPIIFLSTTCFADSDKQIEKNLSSVEVFSPGYNGFAAKKMPQQITYEHALASKDSIEIFGKIYADPTATPEGRSYAACGLWKKKRSDKIILKESFKNSEASVLKADILRKINLWDLIQQIKSHGCH